MVNTMTFQSTLPRGERLLGGCIGYGDGNVSIHAPAWGATTDCITFFALSKVSIHAPAWGATAHVAPKAEQSKVSIHAPAWGATAKPINQGAFKMFQSTLPRGERHLCH